MCRLQNELRKDVLCFSSLHWIATLFSVLSNTEMGRLHIQCNNALLFPLPRFGKGREGLPGFCFPSWFVTLCGALVQITAFLFCLLALLCQWEIETCKGCPKQEVFLDELIKKILKLYYETWSLNSSQFIQIDIMKWVFTWCLCLSFCLNSYCPFSFVMCVNCALRGYVPFQTT